MARGHSRSSILVGRNQRIVMDPRNQNGMSLMDKRQLVYQVARWPQGAVEILQCWTRRELLELINVELGKERKYTNVPKAKLIDHLSQLVSRKSGNKGQLKDDNANIMLSGQDNKDETQMKESDEQSPLKTANSDSTIRREARPGIFVVCSNVACGARRNAGDHYCKRCSCCICNKYDDLKDPSLWLFCSSDNPNSGGSCGFSYHLKCALNSAIVKNGFNKLDCSFCCVSCGKVIWLMRSLRLQLVIARDCRGVSVLCDRLALSHRIVNGSERYKEIASLISSALKALGSGASDQVYVITRSGMVSRLTCGAEVQKLCSSALKIIDSTVDKISKSESNNSPKLLGPQPQILFDEITPFSVAIVLNYQDNIGKEQIDGSKVWHRSTKVCKYSSEPTCHILRPNTRSLVSGLSPSTEYFFKVLPFSSIQGFTEWEAKCSTRSLDHGIRQCSTQNSESVCLKEDSMLHQKKDLNVQNHQRAIQYYSPKGSINSSENNLSCERYSKRAKVSRLDGANDNDESQLPLTSVVLPVASSNSSPSEAPNSASKNYVEQQYCGPVRLLGGVETSRRGRATAPRRRQPPHGMGRQSPLLTPHRGRQSPSAIALFLSKKRKHVQREAAGLPRAPRVSDACNRLGSVVLTLDELKQITNNFSHDQLLGEGTFGKVYKGVLTMEIRLLSRGLH